MSSYDELPVGSVVQVGHPANGIFWFRIQQGWVNLRGAMIPPNDVFDTFGHGGAQVMFQPDNARSAAPPEPLRRYRVLANRDTQETLELFVEAPSENAARQTAAEQLEQDPNVEFTILTDNMLIEIGEITDVTP